MEMTTKTLTQGIPISKETLQTLLELSENQNGLIFLDIIQEGDSELDIELSPMNNKQFVSTKV